MTTIKQWVLENYEYDEVVNINQHGMVAGFAGLTYYSETCAFYDTHKDEIWDMLNEDADDQGVTIMELIASFNGQKNVGSHDQFKNLLTWYAVERVCNEIISDKENEDA
ncbi:MAG: hypothetical protein WC753_04675 [Candidatus Gracilibacteria bacterium]|jgi:hypothetical protein